MMWLTGALGLAKRIPREFWIIAAASIRYERLAQSIRAQERTDRETIRTIYRDKVIPAECAADPRAVSVLSEAVDRANAAASGQSGGTVSGTP